MTADLVVDVVVLEGVFVVRVVVVRPDGEGPGSRLAPLLLPVFHGHRASELKDVSGQKVVLLFESSKCSTFILEGSAI